MTFPLRLAAVVVLLLPGLALAGGNYSVTTSKKAPPDELKPEIAKLLDERAIDFKGKDGKLLAEIWLVKDLSTNGKGKKDKKILTYADIPETTILGVIRFPQDAKDYRNQKVPKGVYTLRFGLQPQDGDHMGTAPYPEFVVLVSAKLEEKAGLIGVKEMQERSASSIKTTHPGVMLLFPNKKPADEPKLEMAPRDHVVLNVSREVSIDGQKTGATLPLGLVLVGHASE